MEAYIYRKQQDTDPFILSCADRNLGNIIRLVRVVQRRDVRGHKEARVYSFSAATGASFRRTVDFIRLIVDTWIVEVQRSSSRL